MGAGGRSAAAGDLRPIALAALAGALAVQAMPSLPPLWWLLPPLGICLVRFPGRALLLAFVLMASYAAWHAYERLADRLPQHRHAEVARVSGHVAGLPQADARRTRFLFDTHAGNAPSSLRLSWYGDVPEIEPGDCWELAVKLNAPRGSLNPGSFDYSAWLLRKGIGATGYVREAEPCPRGHGPGAAVDRLRHAVSRRIEAAVPEPEAAGLLRALSVGDRSGIGDEQWRVLRHTGTSHLMAISGLHVGVAAGFVFFLLRWAAARTRWIVRRPAAVLAASGAGVGALCYASLAGMALPTQRALVMLAVVLLAIVLRRPTSPSHLLALAALAVLAVDPLAVLSPGFWLSFGAVAWILYLLTGRAGGLGRWRLWLTLQPALALALMPLTLYWFGESSLVAPLANAVLIPLFAFVVPAVLTATLALIAWPDLGGLAFAGLAELIAPGWRALAWMARLDFSHLVLPSPPLWAVAAATAGVAWLLAPRGVPARWLGGIGLLPLLMTPAPPPHGGFDLTVLDVGQGLSAVVRTREHVLLFDAGPAYRSGFDAGEAFVWPYLRSQGIGRLDALVVSHGDIDHRGGVRAVMRRAAVDRGYGKTLSRPCRAGRHWTWDGVRFTFLHPDTRRWSDNDGSCVLRVDAPGGSVLLTGDIEARAERHLVATRKAALPADVLLVPHHGSASSSTPAFVRAVDPRTAVVPAGWRNRWGFPDETVARRYRAVGATLLQTGHTGAIRIEARPGSGLAPPMLYRRAHPRYWRAGPELPRARHPS